MLRLLIIFPVLAVPVHADTLVAARTVRSQAILGQEDVRVVPGPTDGPLNDPAQVVGLETRVVLYAGRPIRPSDIGPPAVIDRNDLVTLRYRAGALAIIAEGRALNRAGLGDRVRVMNTSSRTTVTGKVLSDGSVEISVPHS